MSRLQDFAAHLRVASDDLFDTGDIDFDNASDSGSVEQSGQTLDDLVKMVKDTKHPGSKNFMKFYSGVKPLKEKLVGFAQGSDPQHLTPLKNNVYTGFLGQAGNLATVLSDMRRRRDPDPGSETVLCALYTAFRVVRHAGASSGGRSELSENVEEAATTAVNDLERFRGDSQLLWSSSFGRDGLGKLRMRRQLGGTIRAAMRYAKTYKTVRTRAELVFSLPMIGACLLLQPVAAQTFQDGT